MAHNKSEIKIKQEMVLKVAREHPHLSLRSIAQTAGIPYNTVYSWLKRNTMGFADKYEEILRITFKQLENKAIKCISDLIEDGNFQAAKYVLDYRGYSAPKKIEADVNADVEIDVVIE